MVVIASVTCLAPRAWAQQADDEPAAGGTSTERIAPTEKQQELNSLGLDAVSKQNYAKAVSYFEESLFLGELNTTWLYLGRAYKKMGECEEAEYALGQVFDTRHSSERSPEFIERKAADALAALSEQCAEDDGVEPTSDAASSSVDDPGTVEQDTPNGGGRARRGWSIGLMAGGGVFALGGVAAVLSGAAIRRDLDFTTENAAERERPPDYASRFRRADTLTGVGATAIGLGVVSASVGLYLWLSEPKNRADTTIYVAPGRDAGQVGVRIRF